jgi:group I intron endonuclease
MPQVSPFGEVYVHTCLVNDKTYVGQTTAGVSKRWGLHLRCARSPQTNAYRSVFSKAIRKYGADAFEHQTLSVAVSQSELDNLEKLWIILLQSKVPNGYNLSDGGYAAAGHKVSPEVRARLSEATKNQWKSPEFRAHYSFVRKGRKRPQSAIDATTAAHLGTHQSAETIAKRVAKTTGLKRSTEFREQCAARMTGKKLSEETRRKMSASQRERQSRKEKEPDAS